MNDMHVGAALLRFHLGASDDAERTTVDAHLLDCRACLTDFLALKRQFDTAGAFEERPSALARERLRTHVRRRLAVTWTAPRLVLMGVAAVAAAVLAISWFGHLRPPAPSSAQETLIDTGSEARITQLF
jgi:predicted anti-sigma-YlaC factor YlaD